MLAALLIVNLVPQSAAFAGPNKCASERKRRHGRRISATVADNAVPKVEAATLRLDPRASDLLTSEDLLAFERDGHLRVTSLLSSADDEIRPLKKACLQSMESSRSDAALHALNMNGDDVDPPFLQHFNPWRSHPAIAAYARSARLASVAARLLNTDRVRLYQDCIFQKRPGDSPTGWHADLKMAPLDTNSYVTVWIALDDVPAYDDGGTGLHFVSGSHRDFALPFWYGDALKRGGRDGEEEFDLSERYARRIVEQDKPLEAGDSTWHHGWTLHYAPDLFDDEIKDRVAYTASFVADPVQTLGAEATKDAAHDEEDAASYEEWIERYGPGEVVDHEYLPLVWHPPKTGS